MTAADKILKLIQDIQNTASLEAVSEDRVPVAEAYVDCAVELQKLHDDLVDNKEYRCFHCDEVFEGRAAAQKHFGRISTATTQCILKKCLCHDCPCNPDECEGKHGFDREGVGEE